jgi:coenzyme F420-reducing hydrogenase delta subunit/Pyruvate/2-oxoacid:ferredoxin oxidoreductase delta subunit
MCSGRVDPLFVIYAFKVGADGVIVGGCRLGECKYGDGNFQALVMAEFVKILMRLIGLNVERFKLEWVSSAEPARLVEDLKKFFEVVKALGPLGSSEGLSPEDLKFRLGCAELVCQNMQVRATYGNIAKELKKLSDFSAETIKQKIEEKLENLVKSKFEVGAFAQVTPEKCIGCLTCVRVCPFAAPKIEEKGYAVIQIDKCKACGICVKECPAQAIELRPKPEFWRCKRIEKGIKLSVLCCNYTNLSEREDLYEITSDLEIKRFPCGGHIEIIDILQAFREGVEGVSVCMCEKGTCHNKKGNERAEKKVLGAKMILQEIGIDPERVGFFYVPRLDAKAFVEDIKAFYQKFSSGIADFTKKEKNK